MPLINLKNLIIFGDSMSDVGNKRVQAMGMVARALGLMRTNEVGRYSDGKNWTDFVWQWAGGISLVKTDAATSNEATEVHRTLTHDSNQDSGFGRPFYYVNYAEGGAMGASDRPATGLGTFREQVTRYVAERGRFALQGATLHILWFGLNDLVTNGRPADTMNVVVDELGTGMRAIDMELGSHDNYYMVVNLPSPAGAVRLVEANDLVASLNLHKGALVFNAALAGLTNGRYYDRADAVTLVDMFTLVDTVTNDLAHYNLEEGAQPHGVPVNYGTLADTQANRRRVATSDNAHPTEAVYKLMGKHVAQAMVTKFELGNLSQSRLP